MKALVLHLLFLLVLCSGPLTFMSIGAWMCLTHDGDWRLR